MSYRRERLYSHEEWLGARRIGGSTASAILGLNPYKTNQDAYLEIVGDKQPEDISDKECVIYGKAAEEHIRAMFALAHPELEVISPKTIEADGYIEMLQSEEHPFMTATLDGELVEKDTGRKGILEIKTADICSAQKKETWSEGIPDNYQCQIFHYLNVKDDADFVILVAELRYLVKGVPLFVRKEYRFEKSDGQNRAFMDLLAKRETEFWTENVEKKVSPNLRIIL